MGKGIKSFGLSLLAVCALGSVVASAAAGEAFDFKAEKKSTKVTGTQHGANIDTFTFEYGTVKCKAVNYTGEIATETATNFLVTPAFKECTDSEGFGVAIDVNGCQYKFTVVTFKESIYKGEIDLVCPGTEKLQITAFGCNITLAPQTGITAPRYTNVGAGTTRELTVDLELSGLKYEEEKIGAFPTCKNNKITKENGTYLGAALLSGEDANKNRLGIWVEKTP